MHPAAASCSSSMVAMENQKAEAHAPPPVPVPVALPPTAQAPIPVAQIFTPAECYRALAARAEFLMRSDYFQVISCSCV